MRNISFANLSLIAALFFIVAFEANAVVTGEVISTGRGLRNIWVKGSLCGEPNNSCDSMILDSVQVRVNGTLQTFQNVVFSNHQITACSMEDGGPGLHALMLGFMPRTEWNKEDAESIARVEVSQISLVPANLGNLSTTHTHIQGAGHIAKMSIRIVYKNPITLNKSDESLCDPFISGQIVLKEKTFQFGKNYDFSKRF